MVTDVEEAAPTVSQWVQVYGCDSTGSIESFVFPGSSLQLCLETYGVACAKNAL